jgi:hypothetical protein
MSLDAEFPWADSLCERCGYRLQGLPRAGVCPECGLPAIESDPVRRDGLPWQHRLSLGSWFETLRAIALHPGGSFSRLRVGGSNWRDRLFLLSFAVIVGLIWGGIGHAAGMRSPWWWALWVGLAMIGLTYVEVLGVAYFSWRRGWRVDWWLAERVAAYASPGWVVAAVALLKLKMLHEAGWLWRVVPANWGPRFDPYRDLILAGIGGGLAILWFETLVWLGVRQVKFANRPPGSPSAPN